MIIDTRSSKGPVDAGKLGVRIATNGWTLIGLKTVIPVPVVVSKRSRVIKLLGPSRSLHTLDLNDQHIELIFEIEKDMDIMRANVNGAHVDVEGQGFSQHISGIHLPCSLPAFELHFKDNDEATTEPQYGSVEVKR